ncbi:hypothetical protein M271_39230 [Streptomyces rapamycinicus NRRL 5491]|uniref:HTH lysR-type domain-containing protein n=2 Tax=Streptomyces rapamycinicus TaxID=1226757 RepID=A0A0A0NPU6_STRRN|nr:hypothetical protein M271_39230 [Streptomyces rapamycinicus NRRL 5491]RLV77572.1 hypothetical protein D3C57_104345 [Streptomyces rapamycinicus NRRL 5491]UTO66987.1 hypothetical protein LJB45_34850 [Streptomyces rapamycinicus]UTP34944.1 hypothetical protein LIV37_39985 [Streptomyces rapamycinicus NRRL 5491]
MEEELGVPLFQRTRQGVKPRLMTCYSGHLQQWLDDGDLDLNLLYSLDGTPSLNARPLVSERLWAMAPAATGLHADRPVAFAEVWRWTACPGLRRRMQDARRPAGPVAGRG